MTKSAATYTTATELGKAASRAAARRTKTKLSVGPTNDSFEQEADRVASAVTSQAVPAVVSNAAPGAQRAPTISRRVQRQADNEEPQAKLQRQEKEEPQAKLQRQEKEEPQAKLQRQEKEEPQAKLQRQEARADPEEFPTLDRVEDKLFGNKGKGEPLPDETRAEMEAGFGADFRDVRIHTGADAEMMSREIRAQAFTHGKDVFFNSGKFEPETARGKKLLAHELTHVVQQGAAEQKPTRWKPVPGRPGATDSPIPAPKAPRSPKTAARRWNRDPEEDPLSPISGFSTTG